MRAIFLERLADNPNGHRDSDKEQAQSDRATPAEPTAPRAPIFVRTLVPVDTGLFFLLFCHFRHVRDSY